MTKFGEAMMWYMDMQGIQYKELARMTGISVNTLQNYTTKQNSLPNVENALKIAKAFHTTIERMYDNDVYIPMLGDIHTQPLDINNIKKAIKLLQEVIE